MRKRGLAAAQVTVDISRVDPASLSLDLHPNLWRRKALRKSLPEHTAGEVQGISGWTVQLQGYWNLTEQPRLKQSLGIK